MFDLGSAFYTGRLLDMLDSLDKQRLHKLLSDTVPLLCKNTLGCSLELNVEAFIGITLSGENASKEVVMVSFKETLLADGRVSSYAWSEVPSSSPDPPPPLIKPVAFNVSQSGKTERSPQAVDSIDDNASNLERYEKNSPNFVDGRYWPECSETAVSNAVPVLSSDCAKDAVRSSTSSSSLSYPIKAEVNDDIAQVEDESDDFETDARFENTCDMASGDENPYTGVVHHCSPMQHSYGNVHSRRRYPSTAGHSLLNSSQGIRKVTSRPRVARPDSVQHLTSSTCSKSHARMKKAAVVLAVNASVHSSHLQVCKIYVICLCEY